MLKNPAFERVLRDFSQEQFDALVQDKNRLLSFLSDYMEK